MNAWQRPPVLPPGTILQLMYLDERLERLSAGRFVEVGMGRGQVSRALLARGWTGAGYEPAPAAADEARHLCADAIESGRFEVREADWLSARPEDSAVDLVISAMVLEHLTEDDVARYFDRARDWLGDSGRAILFVPGSPRHWGIEDEIAGHHRRYTRDTLTAQVAAAGWRVEQIAGLTYPLSNMLLAVSNSLVRRAEGGKRRLSMEERTASSGSRDVAWKTTYPAAARLVLNRSVLRPFHALQKRAARNPNALVIYGECTPNQPL